MNTLVQRISACIDRSEDFSHLLFGWIAVVHPESLRSYLRHVVVQEEEPHAWNVSQHPHECTAQIQKIVYQLRTQPTLQDVDGWTNIHLRQYAMNYIIIFIARAGFAATPPFPNPNNVSLNQVQRCVGGIYGLVEELAQHAVHEAVSAFTDAAIYMLWSELVSDVDMMLIERGFMFPLKNPKGQFDRKVAGLFEYLYEAATYSTRGNDFYVRHIE